VCFSSKGEYVTVAQTFAGDEVYVGSTPARGVQDFFPAELADSIDDDDDDDDYNVCFCFSFVCSSSSNSH